MKEDLHALLTDPHVFPVELTLTSGGRIRIPHPDYVFFSRKLRKVFFYPPESGGGIVEMLVPSQIAKIRSKVSGSAA